MSFLSDDALERLRRVTEQPDLSGTRYRLEHELGRGGMGIVYQAWDASLERSVALKVIDALSAAEPKILARLEHPGLVPVYDAGSLPDGRLYYAMRLVHGRRLDEYLSAGESLPARLRLFVRICEAVAFAHDCGVIHRDLKPQNIMAGSFGEVFVMDWGIARRMDDSELPPSAGTPPYAAPEASPDRRADIYSLGRILEDARPRQRKPPLGCRHPASYGSRPLRTLPRRTPTRRRRHPLPGRSAGYRLSGKSLGAIRPLCAPQPGSPPSHRRLPRGKVRIIFSFAPLKESSETRNVCVEVKHDQ